MRAIDLKKIDDANIEEIAKLLKAMSEPVRLKVLQCLHDGEMSVGELVSEIGTSQANMSKHLQVLLQSGLVRARKEGTQIYYSVANECVNDLCGAVCGSYVTLMKERMKTLKKIA